MNRELWKEESSGGMYMFGGVDDDQRWVQGGEDRVGGMEGD